MLRDREHDLAVEGEALGEGRGSSGREEGEGQSAEPSSPVITK